MFDTSVMAVPAQRNFMLRGVAVGVGNFMEWFDFAVFGFFAGVIGREFFAVKSPVVSVLSALAVFAVGFLMRPLGGFILGPIGDHYGRRAALTVSIIAMGVGTAMIGCLPTYDMIGVAAPILLVLARCIQGLSAGGEYTGAASFLLEAAPPGRRGLCTSIITGTSALATMTGSFVALGLNSWLSPDQFASFGWRIPFWFAVPLAAIGLVIRLKLAETPVFEVVRQRRQGLDAAGKRNLRRSLVKPMLLTMSLASVGSVGYYYLSSFVSNFLQVTVKLSPVNALMITGIGLFFYMCMTPVAGLLADRFGRRPICLIGTFATMVFIVPIFYLLGTGNISLGIFALFVYAGCLSLTVLTLTVMLVELFPASGRMSGSSIGYNLGAALFSGPGPFIGSWLAT